MAGITEITEIEMADKSAGKNFISVTAMRQMVKK